MTNQRDDAVRKGEHCAWQIHYHFVIPVKCRKALLDEAMTTIVQETAAKIAERFPIEMEAMGRNKIPIHLRGSAHPKEGQPGLCRCSSASRLGRSSDESPL